MENMKELNVLRNERRSTLAKKVLEIVRFCDDNGFQNLYKTKSLMYSTAYSGQYSKVLILKEFEDGYVGISIDEIYYGSYENDEKGLLKYIENSIVCNSEKRDRVGGQDYNTDSWLTPKMREVKDWIENMKSKIQSQINEEIEWLKNWD